MMSNIISSVLGWWVGRKYVARRCSTTAASARGCGAPLSRSGWSPLVSLGRGWLAARRAPRLPEVPASSTIRRLARVVPSIDRSHAGICPRVQRFRACVVRALGPSLVWPLELAALGARWRWRRAIADSDLARGRFRVTRWHNGTWPALVLVLK